MAPHKCPRCGYSTTNVCHFKDHITRKNICKPTLKNVKLDDTIKKYFTVVTQKNECPKCLKTFSTPYCMKRHTQKCTAALLAPMTNIKPFSSEASTSSQLNMPFPYTNAEYVVIHVIAVIQPVDPFKYSMLTSK